MSNVIFGLGSVPLSSPDTLFTTESFLVIVECKSNTPVPRVRLRGYFGIVGQSSAMTCRMRIRQSQQLTASIPSGPIIFDSGTVNIPANGFTSIPFEFEDDSNWIYTGSDYSLCGFASAVAGNAWVGSLSVEGI